MSVVAVIIVVNVCDGLSLCCHRLMVCLVTGAALECAGEGG